MIKKNPSIKVKVNSQNFNSLINLLDSEIKKNHCKVILSLKDKIMKYTLIRDDVAELRFFPSEASLLLENLINNLIESKCDCDYFIKLKENKKAFKKEKEE